MCFLFLGCCVVFLCLFNVFAVCVFPGCFRFLCLVFCYRFIKLICVCSLSFVFSIIVSVCFRYICFAAAFSFRTCCCGFVRLFPGCFHTVCFAFFGLCHSFNELFCLLGFPRSLKAAYVLCACFVVVLNSCNVCFDCCFVLI